MTEVPQRGLFNFPTTLYSTRPSRTPSLSTSDSRQNLSLHILCLVCTPTLCSTPQPTGSDLILQDRPCISTLSPRIPTVNNYILTYLSDSCPSLPPSLLSRVPWGCKSLGSLPSWVSPLSFLRSLLSSLDSLTLQSLCYLVPTFFTSCRMQFTTLPR